MSEFRHEASGAFALVSERGDVLHLANIRVPAEYRRQGIGSDLLYEVCADADRRGMPIVLTIHEGRDSPDESVLRAWYERFGFKRVGYLEMYREPRS